MGHEGHDLNRRRLLGTMLFLPVAAFAAEIKAADAQSLRGRLEPHSEESVAIRLADGRLIRLTGDEKTTMVLHDARLKGRDFEVLGESQRDGSFTVLPIHLAALFVHEKGQRLRVTYYCDVCSIRTYAPGICMCCRQETRLDLVDPAEITKAAGA